MALRGLKKSLATLLLGSALAVPASGLVSVSQMGYHTNQQKPVVVYTTKTSGTFNILDKNNKVVFTGPLTQPHNATGDVVMCQGGQPCLIGDFSALKPAKPKPKDTYRAEAFGERSEPFPIDRNTWGRYAAKFAEPINALQQANSVYHADLRRAQNPIFTMQGDGSPLLTTHMAATAAVRAASAYERDPALMRFDKYGTTKPDIAEFLDATVKYLRAHQMQDGDLGMSGGYEYNFGCPADNDPALARFNTTPDPCMILKTEDTQTNTLEAALVYASAIPTINDAMGKAPAQELLNHTIQTVNYAISQYGTPTGNEAAALGATYFKIADITGDDQYVRKAHALRVNVDPKPEPDQTHWNEFYWDEFARHKTQIQNDGLSYNINGIPADQLLTADIEGDWSGGEHPIWNIGERMYDHDEDYRFNNSRFMLIEGALAAKARQYSSSPLIATTADRQLQWLTGMNSVQVGDGVANAPTRAYSFIHGIGKHGKAQHLRLVFPTFYEGGFTFNNGAKFVPMWIPGAYDSTNDSDQIFNYDDKWGSWTYTESTTEKIMGALENFAYQDGYYNGRARLSRLLH